MNNAFHRLEEGYENANQYMNNINIVECYVRYENALKDYYKKQISQLNALIVLLLGSLSKGDRQKVGTKENSVFALIEDVFLLLL